MATPASIDATISPAPPPRIWYCSALFTSSYYNNSGAARVRRRPDRASYVRADVEAILDEAFLCHVGLIADDAPVVIPMVYGRARETLYLHGSPASRLLKGLSRAARACVTVTVVDGLVLARAASKHSVNYRSVVAFGAVRALTDADEKSFALRTIVDHLLPGRTDEARAPTANELSTTSVVAFSIEEVAAKWRTGPPVDNREDEAAAIWAGVVPMGIAPGEPVAEQKSSALPLPASIRALVSAPPAHTS